MNKTKKFIFVLLAITTLLIVPAQSILAAEVFEYTTDSTQVRVKYTDDTYGTIPMNTTDYVIDDWPDYHSYIVGDKVLYNESMKEGVQMGAFFENEGVVSPQNGESVSCTYQMYTLAYAISDGGLTYSTTTVTPLIQYYINLSSSDVMNGVQEAYYRSPVNWSDEYTSYYINIYDSSDNIVFTGEYNYSEDFTENRRANNIGFVEDNRIFFKINFKLYSGERYRIVEGAQIDDFNPVTTMNVFFASQQDIANDGEMDSYMFPGTPQARKYESLELSWSIVCTVGIGLAGTEKLIDLGAATSEADYLEIMSQDIYGTSNDVDYINLTIPFRFTHPTNLTIFITSYGTYNSDVGSASTLLLEFPNVTGILDAKIPILDNDAGSTNMYRVFIRIYRDVNESFEGRYMTYTMIPTIGAVHKISATNDTNLTMIAIPHFAMHIEIEEGNEVGPGMLDLTTRFENVLLGITEILLGFVIMGVVMPIMMLPIGREIFDAGGSLAARGYANVVSGITGFTSNGDWTVPHIIEQMIRGAYKILKVIWDGLVFIAQKVVDFFVWAVSAIPSFINTCYEYFEIFLDLLYFLGFLVVIWIWTKFLKIMDGIVSGDIDQALATTTTVINKSNKQVKKGARIAAKTVVLGKKGGKIATKAATKSGKFIAPLMPPLNRKLKLREERKEFNQELKQKELELSKRQAKINLQAKVDKKLAEKQAKPKSEEKKGDKQ